MEYGTLYIVATPIGNSQDMSPRGIKVLTEVDIIAAEDTRRSMILLNKLDIHNKLMANHKFNEHGKAKYFMGELKEGKSIAVITDAGTPCISDPGNELIKAAVAEGIKVVGIPGCCAAVNALAVSGLPTGRFTFEGFLSMNKKERREHLESLQYETRTMIFHEAPHKLQNTLKDFLETFGPERRISLCRELTKLHEEVIRTTLGGAIEKYRENGPKGEFVLIVAGGEPEVEEAPSETDAAAYLAALIQSGLSRKDAIKQTAKDLGLPKNVVYDLALKNPE
jgi:16S rRNA (cytidine1402-2'-O)-methyltransferase